MSEITFSNYQIQQIKNRAKSQFNWTSPTVLSLISTIENLQKENKRLLASKYKYKCGNCNTFTQNYSNHCPNCEKQGYLSGSYSPEELEKWIDNQ